MGKRRLIRRSGEVRWVTNTAKSIDKGMAGANWRIGTLLDITETEEAAQTALRAFHDLERTNQALEQFAYAASHDLREPLNTITNFVNLLSKMYGDKFDAQGRKILGFTLSAAERMKELVKALLDYSRLGVEEFSVGTVDFVPLLNDVIVDRNHTITAAQANIEIKGRGLFIGNEVQLHRVFVNLIQNGIKYQQKDRIPEILISIIDKPDCWEFRVKDNGIGIEEKYWGRVFEIFRQLHPRDRYGGVGLGLSLSQRIIQLHGGEIWLESEVGIGTTFIFTIRKQPI